MRERDKREWEGKDMRRKGEKDEAGKETWEGREDGGKSKIQRERH